MVVRLLSFMISHFIVCMFYHKFTFMATYFQFKLINLEVRHLRNIFGRRHYHRDTHSIIYILFGNREKKKLSEIIFIGMDFKKTSYYTIS